MRTCLIGVWVWVFVGCVNAPTPGRAGPSAGMAGSDLAGAGSTGPLKPPIAPSAGAAAAAGAAKPRAASAGARAPFDAAADGGGYDATPQRSAGPSANQSTESQAPWAGSAAPPHTPAPSFAGQLVINELMIDPKTLSDTQGEWLELKNTGALALDLQGCSLDDGSKEPRPIAASLVAPAFGYLTIARTSQPGFEPSYVTSLSFTNTADTIALRCGDVEIDRVSYDKARGYPLVSGASLSLDPGQQTAQANDAADAWCLGTESYGPELGTPGRANPPCDSGGDAGIER
jgi:hypothetical protein